MENYRRTVITVEVLSDGPFEWSTLEDVHYAITEGDCSGHISETSEEVSKEKMRELLIAQGSDPAFLFGEE